MIGIRTIAESLTNDSTVAVWGESMTYTDTNGDIDVIEAVFDEAYQLTTTGADGAKFTMTVTAVSARVGDFVNAEPECDGEFTIGTRLFVVASVEQTGHDDMRLILTERV